MISLRNDKYKSLLPAILGIALLAVLYAVTGWLGSLLAIPPGYATLIWPASGLAIGMMLVHGRRLWPGVFLGSFTLNLALSADFSFAALPGLNSFLIAAGVATGATLQALLGYWLVSRILGIPLAFRNAKDAIKLFLLSGPAACLVSTTVGVSTLYAVGAVAADGILANWWTWWVGDVLGVAVFLPLVLVAPWNPSKLKWRDHVLATLPATSILALLTLLGVTFYAWKISTEIVAERNEARFEALAQESEKALLHRMDTYHLALMAGAGFFNGSGFVSHEQWKKYVVSLHVSQNYPGINGVGYIQPVPTGELSAFIKSMQADSLPDFTVHPKTGREEHFVINYIEPVDRNIEAVGLDIAFEKNRREAAIISRDTGKSTITKRILLVQDRTKSPGFLLLHPLYPALVEHTTVAQRRAVFKGWVYAPFIGRNFMDDLTKSQGTLLELAVYDGHKASSNAVIFDSRAGSGGDIKPQFTVTKHLTVMQQPWTLVWTSTQAFEASVSSDEPMLILIGGLLLTTLLAAFLFNVARRTEIVQSQVEEQTREIAANEEQMKLLVRNVPAAVAMFDREMRYILTSERWLKDYRLQNRDIVGKSHYEVLPALFADEHWRDKCQRALQGMSVSDEEYLCKCPDGHTEWIKGAIHPWINSENQVGGIVLFAEIITEQKVERLRSALLREIALEAAVAPTVDAIFASAMQKVCVYLNWSIGHAYVWDDQKKTLASSSIWHIQDEHQGHAEFRRITEDFEFVSGIGLPGRALQSKRPVFVPNVATDTNFPRNKIATNLELRSAVGIPIVVNNQVAAVLEFFSLGIVEETEALASLYELIGIQLGRVIERRQFETALQDSNRLNNAILDSASYLIVATDHEGKILVFNRQAEASLGYSHEEVVGRATPAMWHDKEEVDTRAHELSEELGEPVKPGFDVFTRKALKEGSEFHEWTFIRKDGTRFPGSLTATPLIAENHQVVGFLGVIEDITERVAQRQALETSEEMFRLATENASIGMALVSLTGRWLNANKALCTLLGYSEEELQATNFQAITHPDDVGIDIAQRKRVMSGEIQSFQAEIRYFTKSRKIIWALLSVSLVRNADGSPRYFIKQIQDISERKAVERLKSEFIATVSHELRTPLTSIRGALGLMANGAAGELPASIRRLTQIANENSDRLSRLVNDILDVEKLEAGAVEMFPKNASVNELLDRAITSNQPYAERYQVEFVLSPAKKDPQIYVDADRFLQIMANLLSNAAKFSRPGGKVDITVVECEGFLRVSVRDYGTGIPPAFRKRIFQQFAQADNADNKKHEGTGLGLNIAKRLTEAMGGSISFESEENVGTVFHLDFQLASATKLKESA